MLNMDKKQENIILEMYKKRRPLAWMEKETGIPYRTIQKWLKERGVWTGHKSLLNYFDEFFFDNIDTEEKAYWLGFIYADGYLNKNDYGVGIELKASDYNHLVKFKNAIQSEKEVKIYHKNSTFGPQDNCRFIISSKHMKQILLGYFGSINKTLEGQFPKIEKELEHHLVRGFFDGDGCLTGFRDDNHIFRPELGFIGTHKTLEYIEEISGFSWSWSQRVKTNIDNYQICCGRVNDCLKFLSYMYKDATIYLDRKYELYQKLLENRERLKAKARV